MNADPDRSAVPSKGVIFFTLFLDLVGFSIIFPLFPSLLDHYLSIDGSEGFLGGLVQTIESWVGDVEGTERSWRVQILFGGILGSVYSILQFGFSPIWGRISDRIGRRPVLLWTVGGIALSYVLWMLSGSFLLFVIARILGGLFSGNLSVASAAMADITDHSNRAAGMGIVGAAFGLGFILGPALGGWLSQYNLLDGSPALADFGFNPFSVPAIGALLLSVINWIWIWRRFGESLPPENRRSASEGRTSHLGRLFRPGFGPAIARANFAYFVFLVAFSGMEFTLTFLVRDRFAWTPLDMAGMFVYVGFVIAFVQGGIVRRLVPRFGERKVAFAGLVIVIPGLVALGLAQDPGWPLFSGLTLMAFGSALTIPTLTSLVSRYAPIERQGAALGVFRSLGALARAVGPISAAIIYFSRGNAWPYLIGAGLLVIPLAVILKLPNPAATSR